MPYDYDLFVIGAGSGGVRVSRIAAELGAKVAIAEDLYFGGTCVNVGCVPKKLFVYASEFIKAFSAAPGFGWSLNQAHFDWPTLIANKNKEIARLNGIYENMLRKAGVEIISGHARLLNAHTVAVAGQQYSAKNIVIAVGGWPRKPDIPGSEYMIDSNQAFYLQELPRRILIQGGGYIASEFAGVFNGLGCDTELLYRGNLFLRGFDDEIRNIAAREIAKTGVRLSFNADIESIEKQPDNTLRVHLNNGEERVVDTVMTAIGRVPKTQGLGLENTRVALGEGGEIEVDDNFQTQEPSIYALGDVIGRVALTPVALAEGMALANHLFGNKPIKLDYNTIASAVFCQPNIATVGLTEAQAKTNGKPYAVFTSEFKPLKNTLSGSEQRTFIKLLVDTQSDRIIGVHMIGPDAAEIMQGIAIAITAGATKAQFDATVGIHPTAAEEFVSMRSAIRTGP